MSKDKDIMPINDKGQPHGLWGMYHFNGKLMFKSFYLNGKRVGYSESNYLSGKITSKKYYL